MNYGIPSGGQDWFVRIQDSDREGDHLCQGSEEGYECARLRCVVSRALANEDSNDMSFAPTAANSVKMVIMAPFSYILFNQGSEEAGSRQVLQTISNSGLEINIGALSGVALSLAALGVGVAVSAF